MNRMKKFASLFLSFLLILSALPSAVYAEENTLQEIEAGILEVTEEESVKEEDISNAVSDENIVGIEAAEEASTLNAMEGMCGDSLEWEISNSGVLTISGYGEMENYSSGNAPWYSERSNIKKIKIK